MSQAVNGLSTPGETESKIATGVFDRDMIECCAYRLMGVGQLIEAIRYSTNNDSKVEDYNLALDTLHHIIEQTAATIIDAMGLRRTFLATAPAAEASSKLFLEALVHHQRVCQLNDEDADDEVLAHAQEKAADANQRYAEWLTSEPTHARLLEMLVLWNMHCGEGDSNAIGPYDGPPEELAIWAAVEKLSGHSLAALKLRGGQDAIS